MKLTEIEREMHSDAMGEPRRMAVEHQLKVGRFFDAADTVEIGHVHIMADTEALGESGVRFLEEIATFPEDDRKVRVTMNASSPSSGGRTRRSVRSM